MMDEAKLSGPIWSTFEALAVKSQVGPYHGELGPIC